MESGAILDDDLNEEPQCSVLVPTDRDETYSIVADPGNLAGWWSRPGRSVSGTGVNKVHFDADPALHRVDLRWGEDGDWRHVRIAVDENGSGSRVTMTVLPVPGCPAVCLEEEATRTAQDIERLRTILRSRSHLLGSDDYWI